MLGKSRKVSVMLQQDKQFDITTALKTRKPLRKTTMATLMEEVDSKGGMDTHQQLQSRMKGRKLSIERGMSLVLTLSIHMVFAFSVQRYMQQQCVDSAFCTSFMY